MANYERLSAIDQSFLQLEQRRTPMHVGATCIFEAGPLARPGGGVDAQAIRDLMLASIAQIPRYRQRIDWVPLENRPVWVADPHFQINYHVRHTALPHPGTDEQLKELAARLMEQPLDRDRPLWELWIVEGLEGNRFATIHKLHHCMADGSSGVDLMQALLQDSPHAETPRPAPLPPVKAPGRLELLQSETMRRLLLPARALFDAPEVLSELRDLGRGAGVRGRALMNTLMRGFAPPPLAPFNGTLSPHRRIDWFSSDVEALHEVGATFGATINDVVLAAVSGAVSRYLESWGEDPQGHAFRVAVPVDVRPEAHAYSLGNEVSAWFVDLPLGEPDPVRRLRLVCEQTSEARSAHAERGIEALAEAVALLPSQIVALGLRGMLRLHPFNMVVSNVPGPPAPLYSLGARLLAVHPHLLLADPLGLGVAVMSYAGGLHWGLIADWDLVPDLADFTRFLRESEEELRKAAAIRAGAHAVHSDAE